FTWTGVIPGLEEVLLPRRGDGVRQPPDLVRSRLNYQFTRELSLRVIVELVGKYMQPSGVGWQSVPAGCIRPAGYIPSPACRFSSTFGGPQGHDDSLVSCAAVV